MRQSSYKKKEEKKIVSRLNLTEPYRLASKYFPRIFAPSQIVDQRWIKVRWSTPEEQAEWLREKFITTDGKIVRIKFIGTWNNNGQYYAEQFEDICQRMFNMSFSQVQSHWFARLGYLDQYWDMMDLELVDDNA